MLTKLIASGVIAFLPTFLFSQTFKEVTILSDTTLFYRSKNSVQYLGEEYFFFKVKDYREAFEITFYPEQKQNVLSVQILPSSDVAVADSLIRISNRYFRGKVRLKEVQEIGNSLFLNIQTDNGKYTEEIKLFPFLETEVSPNAGPIELYAGEEKTIELPAINASNLNVHPDWIHTNDYDYSLSTDNGSLKIQVHPYTTGDKDLVLNLKTISPFLDSKYKLSFNLKPIAIHFTVKPSRLNFINSDKTDFFFDNTALDNSEEIQLDQKKGLEQGKVYRIENRLESGGKLIAELFVKTVIGDNKVLCSLHSYSYHKITDGYLYLKQGSEVKYITNFNILQKPTIDNIYLLHEGEDWSPVSIVHPGETVQVKIEGKGLAKTKINFSSCIGVKQDSTRIFDDVVFYSLTVPLDIDKKVVYVEMNKKRTKYELPIKENQRPRDFDFISVNYCSQNVCFTSSLFSKPVLESRPLSDINISFNTSQIDEKNLLYGKQYLDFEFKLFNSKNDLIEDEKLENVVLCPDESSLRGKFYNRKDCFKSTININDYLLHKTYELEQWSKVEIIVKHSAGKYNEPGYSRRIIIIKQRFSSIDLQASFPAGLLIKEFRSKGIGELSGLSIAFLAQMTFYEKEEIAKPKPFKIGAGIIALNVFNLTSTTSQPDIGAVAIGTILPMRPEKKFNLPLYFGVGYMLKSGEWFTLLGPGVQFNF